MLRSSVSSSKRWAKIVSFQVRQFVVVVRSPFPEFVADEGGVVIGAFQSNASLEMAGDSFVEPKRRGPPRSRKGNAKKNSLFDLPRRSTALISHRA